MTYCYAHPDRETSLRCKRCENPICPSCAKRTPTGYMCPDCVKRHQKAFDTALPQDYFFGFGATFILSFLVSAALAFVSAFIGFYMIFIAVAVAGGVGVFLADTAMRVTGKRRSRMLFTVCAAGVVVGVLPMVLIALFTGNISPLLTLGIYAAVATSTVYTRLAGIQLR